MSFSRSKEEAHAIIHSIEESPTTGHGMTSQILRGHDTPGGAANVAKPAHETQQVGRLRAGIRTPKTRTDKLTRRYGSA